jgi:GNAT superfamily N-acetyltransferase
VWSDGGIVVAYFSLCPHEVRREILPRRIAHGAPDAVPAILLARLALDSSLQGQGLGESLLIDALERATAAVGAAGGRLIAVDAIDSSAAELYEHYGFVRCPDVLLRLVRKSSDVARSLGA